MATRAGFNTKSPTIKRILSESREMSLHPDPSLTAHPLESNLFEWHFTLSGPPSSPYEHGIYHGRIILPPSYPLRPPMFRFTTPSGRFETNREICLSISGHHEETWQPAWGIRTALCAIRAFMESNAAGQVGGLDVSEEARRRYARESRGWRCEVCGVTNEETMGECARRWEEAREKGLVREGGNEVPEELRLAYKEDLGGEKKKGEEGDSAPGVLKEVTTTSTQTQAVEGAAGTGSSSGQDAANRTVTTRTQQQPAAASPRTAGPASSIAQTTSSASTSIAPTPTRTVAPTQVVSPDDGVPAWVDKAIFGVLLSLVLMILKRMIA